MGRNLYILAATVGGLALICFLIPWTRLAHTAGDRSLWSTMGTGLFVVALLIALGAIMSSLFEQAETKAEEQRLRNRKK